MSQDRGGGRSNAALDWPVVVLGLGVLAALVLIIVTGHNVDDLVRALGALFSATGAIAGIGAYVKSSKAVRQTNGDLDARMKDAVHTGITTALVTANQQQAKRAKRVTGEGPTVKVVPPAGNGQARP